jgi:hypothetical protein
MTLQNVITKDMALSRSSRRNELLGLLERAGYQERSNGASLVGALKVAES